MPNWVAASPCSSSPRSTTPRQALIALADANRDAPRLLLVGHNPGLEQLVALLHSGQSGDYRGMPPGAVAVLGMPADAALEPGIARLDAFCGREG